MVNSILNFFRKIFIEGSYDWFIQPITTFIVLFYGLTVTGFLFSNSVVTFYDWKTFITSMPMQIATLSFLPSICWHIWSSMQALLTSYLQPSTIRSMLLWIVGGITAVYYIWGVMLVLNI